MTWETVPLGKVARVDAKAAQPSDIEADTPYVGLEHIGAGGTIDVSTLAGDADLKSAKNRFDARHVLFGKLRPNLGKVARPAVAGVCSTDIYPLLASDRLDRNYLAHYLLTPKAIAFSSSRTSGVNLPRVTWSALSDLPLPLPPLPEQRRIAAILDEADALRSRSAQARSKRRELRSRLLHASFAEAAGVADLGAYISESQNGLYKPQSAYGQGTPIVRIDAFDGVEPGFQGELKRLTISEEERSRFGVRPGDILINRVNALSHLGKSVLVPALREPIVFESNMMRVSLREGGLAPAVVAGWLSTDEARSQIQQRAKKAINQASINQRDVASLQVPALSPRQQSALVERLDGLDASRAASERRIAELDALFASLQHRAFRGEL